MKSLFLPILDQYELMASDLFELTDKILVVKKWNWKYDLAHKFQRHCLDYLKDKSGERVLIVCNHPHVLTNGRGLQKSKKGQSLELLDFNPNNFPKLPFPLFQIERGGGLTFHHPGQFIFYPIVKLNPQTLSLSKMIDDIFDFTIEVLESWGVQNLTHQNDLLGLWLGDRKLASMGIAIEKLTTFHGMALNLYQDDEMMKAMSILNPCGLTSSTYLSVNELIYLESNSLEIFSSLFLEKIKKHWG